jgi:hypothetical protein
VRYEVNTAPVELRNRLVNYYPALGGLVQAGTTAVLSPLANATGGIGAPIGQASGGVPRAGFNTDFHDFAPRIGFAWDPLGNGNTVVRGAYAIVYDQQPIEPSVNMLANPPFVQDDLTFFDELPLYQSFGTLNTSVTSANALPYSIVARDPNTTTAYVQQFHFGVQHQLGNKALAEIAYVGSLGRHLPVVRDINNIPCTAQQALAGAPCLSITSNPFVVTSILDQETTGTSSYNSLQLRFSTRKYHGLQFDAHYEMAKSLDDSSSLQPQVFLVSLPYTIRLSQFAQGANPEEIAGISNLSPTLSLRAGLPIITTRPSLPQNSSDIGAERGLSDFNVHNRVVFSYIYDVPKWAPRFGEGWQVAGISTLQTGQPYSVYLDFFGRPLRPDLLHKPSLSYGGPNAIDSGTPLCPSLCSSAPASTNSAFGLADAFQDQPGDLGRNTFTGPGLVNFDTAFLKNIKLRPETTALQFRLEFFNLFNRANFYQPYSHAGSFTTYNGSIQFVPDPNFGQILQARPGREVQLALKLTF